jgi:hypothetical protein
LSCPEATAGTQLLTNEEMGYCLLYPDGYSRVDPLPYEVCLVSEESFMACHSANLMIEVEAAAGRTARQIADEIVAEAAIPGIEIQRTYLTVSNEQAVVLEGLPGVASSRAILTVHSDRLYRLTFVPWDETGGEWARVESLYDVILNSFAFLPTPAWTLPSPQQLFVPADDQGTQFMAEADGVYKFEIITGSYSVCPSGGADPACGKWRSEILAYVNRDITWTAQVDGLFGPADPDFRLGSWLAWDTAAEAEANSGGVYPISLQEGDSVWLLPIDERDAYDDNVGGMTVSISIMAPLP